MKALMMTTSTMAMPSSRTSRERRSRVIRAPTSGSRSWNRCTGAWRPALVATVTVIWTRYTDDGVIGPVRAVVLVLL